MGFIQFISVLAGTKLAQDHQYVPVYDQRRQLFPKIAILPIAFVYFSSILDSRCLRTAFLLPVQQHTPQQVPICTMKPIRSIPTATHMKASMFVPNSASMLNSAAWPTTFLKMTNIAVAITAAAAVNSSARKVRMVTGSCRKNRRLPLCDHLGFFEKPIGARKMQRKERMAPTRKQANM